MTIRFSLQLLQRILLARQVDATRRSFSIDASTLSSMESQAKLVIKVDTEFEGDYDAEIVSALN